MKVAFAEPGHGKSAAGLQKWKAVSVTREWNRRRSRSPSRRRRRRVPRSDSDSSSRSADSDRDRPIRRDPRRQQRARRDDERSCSESRTRSSSRRPKRSQHSLQPGNMFVPSVLRFSLAELHSYFSSKWGACMIEQPRGKGFANLTFADGSNMPEPGRHDVPRQNGPTAVTVKEFSGPGWAGSAPAADSDTYGSISPAPPARARRRRSRSKSRRSASRSASRSNSSIRRGRRASRNRNKRETRTRSDSSDSSDSGGRHDSKRRRTRSSRSGSRACERESGKALPRIDPPPPASGLRSPSETIRKAIVAILKRASGYSARLDDIRTGLGQQDEICMEGRPKDEIVETMLAYGGADTRHHSLLATFGDQSLFKFISRHPSDFAIDNSQTGHLYNKKVSLRQAEAGASVPEPATEPKNPLLAPQVSSTSDDGSVLRFLTVPIRGIPAYAESAIADELSALRAAGHLNEPHSTILRLVRGAGKAGTTFYDLKKQLPAALGTQSVVRMKLINYLKAFPQVFDAKLEGKTAGGLLDMIFVRDLLAEPQKPPSSPPPQQQQPQQTNPRPTETCLPPVPPIPPPPAQARRGGVAQGGRPSKVMEASMRKAVSGAIQDSGGVAYILSIQLTLRSHPAQDGFKTVLKEFSPAAILRWLALPAQAAVFSIDGKGFTAAVSLRPQPPKAPAPPTPTAPVPCEFPQTQLGKQTARLLGEAIARSPAWVGCDIVFDSADSLSHALGFENSPGALRVAVRRTDPKIRIFSFESDVAPPGQATASRLAVLLGPPSSVETVGLIGPKFTGVIDVSISANTSANEEVEKMTTDATEDGKVAESGKTVEKGGEKADACEKPAEDSAADSAVDLKWISSGSGCDGRRQHRRERQGGRRRRRDGRCGQNYGKRWQCHLGSDFRYR